MLSRALSFIFLLLTVSVGAYAQGFGTTGDNQSLSLSRSLTSISGLIRTGEGRPAKDARIEVHDRQSGQVIAQAYANASGSFEVNVPQGTYEVVGQLGLEEARETVYVQATTAMVSLRLPGAAPAEAGNGYSVSVAQMKVPEKARKAFKKAQAAMDKEKVDEAHKYVAEALEVYPEYSEALTLRGILSLGSNNLQEAMTDLQRAIKADNNYATAYLALGAAYNALSQFDDALRVL